MQRYKYYRYDLSQIYQPGDLIFISKYILSMAEWIWIERGPNTKAKINNFAFIEDEDYVRWYENDRESYGLWAVVIAPKTIIEAHNHQKAYYRVLVNSTVYHLKCLVTPLKGEDIPPAAPSIQTQDT